MKRKSLISIFYKPLGMSGGDVNDFKETINYFNSKYNTKVLCVYPRFWGKFKSNESLNFQVGYFEIFINLIHCLFSRKPIEFALFESKKLKLYLNKNRSDFLIVRGVRVSYVAEYLDFTKSILIMGDSLSRLFYSRYKNEKNIFKKIYYLLNFYGYTRVESVVNSSYDNTVLFSNSDLSHINNLSYHKYDDSTFFIPLGVSSSFIRVERKEYNRNILVFGVHSASHNLSRLWSLLTFAPDNPEYNFHIVGPTDKLPSKLLDLLHSIPNIKIYGFIKNFNDLYSIIDDCFYSYCHYTFRGGMQNSVLISMAMQQHLIISENIKNELLENKLSNITDINSFSTLSNNFRKEKLFYNVKWSTPPNSWLNRNLKLEAILHENNHI